MATIMTQMNIRIERDLKSAGDAALARIGFSPSQAIRNLWARAAERGEALQQVERLLTGASTAQQEKKTAGPNPTLQKGWDGIDGKLASLGIDSARFEEIRPASTDAAEAASPASDRDLLSDALYERMVERGLGDH